MLKLLNTIPFNCLFFRNNMANNRNLPCHCGSGKKYKRCHLSIDEQVSINLEASNPEPLDNALLGKITQAISKVHNSKICSVPEALKDSCSKIIQAHTVSKSLGLKQIARDGKVMGLKSHSMHALHEQGGDFAFAEIGVQKASTIHAFCSHHDASIFSPIENQPFQKTEEQCFLIVYRSQINEWYKAQNVGTLSPELIKLLPKDPFSQFFMQKNISEAKAKLADKEFDKERYEEILLNKNYGDIKHYIFEGDGNSNLVCSFSFAPQVSFDHNHKELQDFSDFNKRLISVSINTISQNQRNYTIISWHATDDSFVRNWLSGLVTKSNKEIESILTKLIFQTSENVYFSCDWCDQLTTIEKNQLSNWAQPMQLLDFSSSKDIPIYFMDLQSHGFL